ncbi:MAG: hypothetical protein CW742_13400, partial [Methanoregula sp.]
VLMPIKIECGCNGFHVLSTEGRNKILVSADNLKAVHLALDHHYWRYLADKKGKQRREGKVVGCPLCEMMHGGSN